MRQASIKRKTKETDVSVFLSLDGQGKNNISSSCGFLDHMLTLFSHHSLFDIDIKCKGDTEVDFHHSTEDVAIALGECFKSALADKAGIRRFASNNMAMDESLVNVTIDISSRPHLSFNCDFPSEKVGDFDTELVREFFEAFARESGITIHINKLQGKNSHHIAEAIFKCFAITLRSAVEIDEKVKSRVPSTKGVI